MSESLAGYFTYPLPGADRVIHLSLDAVDGILSEVMTGFGAIPRRGAEVGGLLLGRDEGNVTWIETFAMAPCEHRRGPSFLLSDQDRAGLAAIVHAKHGGELAPVGMFRSNTRDSDTVSNEDRTLFNEYFAPPSGVFLLIRPFASKTSTAAFLVYRDGELPESNDNVFPFLRRELEGGPAPVRRPLGERRRRPAHGGDEDTGRTPGPAEGQPLPTAAETTIAAVAMEQESLPGDSRTFDPILDEVDSEQAYDAQQFDPSQYQRRRGWIWIPLSFIFLLLGVLLGFQTALTFYPRQTTVDAAAFGLGLTATAKDENVHIRWNRESPAIRAAQRGRLEIQDGKFTKTVELDSGALQTGSVMYPPLSQNLNLRLQLTIKGSSTVSETLDWSKGQP
jgi:hypothetical protein